MSSEQRAAGDVAASGAERVVRIGTRASPMALAQAERVAAELTARTPRLRVEVVPMTTAGDRWSGSLSALGGKGAFTREVDAALLAGEVDLAVHCMKDVPGDRPVPAGTVFAGYPVRDDPRDALVHPGGLRLAELPAGTRIGTSAVRRVAQLARDFPGLETVPIRGNANTRLAKLDAGEFDALLLAVSGLERIGERHRASDVLPATTMLPAIGAGVLGLQCREDDAATVELVGGISDPGTWRQVNAERIMLHVLQGHCNSPIAGHATAAGDGTLTLVGEVYSLDGKQTITATDTAAPGDAVTLGTSVALNLLRQGANELIAAAAAHL